MPKQPNATNGFRTQASWANHLVRKLEAEIQARENELDDRGVPPEEWDADPQLADLYDDVIFWERHAEEMEAQVEYYRTKFPV